MALLVYSEVLPVAGGPCTAASTRCRQDTFTARRMAGWPSAGKWCSNGLCLSPPIYPTSHMVRNNGDSAGDWYDHNFPQLALLSNSTIAIIWHDYRDDTTSAGWFQNRTRVLRYGGGALLSSVESVGWPTGSYARWTTFDSWWGDIDRPANAQLHAHFFGKYPQMAPTSGLGTIGIVWSPRNPQQ